MKLSISNIAWPAEAETCAAGIMAACGIQAVEIAPTRIWPKPLEASPAELDGYRRFWEDRGIQIVAAQSLLFGRPDLTIFESAAKRTETLAYLRRIMELSSRLGARVLVFGSPKHRRIAGLPANEVAEIAGGFFHQAGRDASALGVMLCIEPNPPQYDCDFITSSAEGLALVRQANTPGFGLHLDAAGMTLAGEPVEDALQNCSGHIEHFHASEPFLTALGTGGVDHRAFGRALRQIRYSNFVSVEMRPLDPGAVATGLPGILDTLKECYGPQ